MPWLSAPTTAHKAFASAIVRFADSLKPDRGPPIHFNIQRLLYIPDIAPGSNLFPIPSSMLAYTAGGIWDDADEDQYRQASPSFVHSAKDALNHERSSGYNVINRVFPFRARPICLVLVRLAVVLLSPNFCAEAALALATEATRGGKTYSRQSAARTGCRVRWRLQSPRLHLLTPLRLPTDRQARSFRW